MPAVIVPSFAEGRFQLGEHLERRVGTVRFIAGENLDAFASLDFDAGDFRRESAGRLRGSESLLRALRPAILVLARELLRVTRSSVCQPECSPENASSNPSRSMLSWISALPMRWPQRPLGSRYGARSMFSMPPAIAASMSPSQISCAAEAIACAPEPQTRLTVSAGTANRNAAADRRLPRRIHAVARLDDVAHHHAVDARGVERGASQRFANDDGAQLGGRRVFQRAVERSDRGANRMTEDDVWR